MAGADRNTLIRELTQVVGPRGVVYNREELLVYECDGITVYKVLPEAVVFPTCTDEVARVVQCLHRLKVPFTARGAGTGLSGGALAAQGGVLIALTRMNKILEIDYDNRVAVVEPGVINLWLSEAMAGRGFLFAPDPSSQAACTIGGNVAENSGGPHTLKYGVTTNHVLGLEVVLPDGRVIELGSKAADPLGYDLTGVLVGSEGTLGIVTKAIVRIVRRPQAVRTSLAAFNCIDDASNAVSEVIERGILPAALEMMDRLTLQAVEKKYRAGYPVDAAAVLLIELDGLEAGMDQMGQEIEAICRRHAPRQVRKAASEKERALLWAGRKGAFGAIGQISPEYYVQDGVIPRTRLAEVLREIDGVAREFRLQVANVFHAGDGNLHPLIPFDSRVPGEVERVVEAGSQMLRICIDKGGSISGEHGIGVEKAAEMALLFSPTDLSVMKALKEVFNPEDLLNPGKIFPDARRCVEVSTLPRLARRSA